MSVRHCNTVIVDGQVIKFRGRYTQFQNSCYVAIPMGATRPPRLLGNQMQPDIFIVRG
jgi:hypothetical protein